MTTRSFNIAAIFRGDTTQLKQATQEARNEVASVGQEADRGASGINRHAEALEKDAAAAREAAAQWSTYVRQARERVAEASGARPLPRGMSAFGDPSANPFEGFSSGGAHASAFSGQSAMLKGIGADVEATRRETALYRAELDAVRARYNPLFAASKRYEQELQEIAAAERLGAISALEAANARDVAAARMTPMINLSRQHGGAMRLQAHEARNLTYQLNDVFQSLLLGMPPTQVLLQQGPQITQIYGGVGNTFRALRAALTPARVALGGTTAALITGAVAWNNYLTSVKAVEAAALGIGRASAGTSAEMEAAARAGAAAAGISIREARSMETAFLRTGTIGAANFEALIGSSRDFAATIGIDAAEAGGALAEMFSDPAKAADTLWQKYGLIDAATRRQVINLAQQNRATEAQTLLMDAMQPRLVDAADATTALGRAWQFVKEQASNAGNAIGATIDRAVSGPSRDEELRSELEAARQRLALASSRDRNSRNWSEERRVERQSAAEEEIRRLELELATRSGAEGYRLARARAEQRGRAALTIAEASPVNETSQRERELRNRIATLEGGVNAPGLDDTQRGEIATDIEAKTRALDALVNRQERTAELDRLEIQIANERNPLIRAELEARRERLRLSQDEISSTALETSVARARTRVVEETIAAARTRSAEMASEAEIRQRLTGLAAAGVLRSEDANRLLQEELELRPLVAAAAMAEGDEKMRLLGVIDALRAAQADAAAADREARAVEAAQANIRTQAERLAMLRLEIALIGRSAEERSRLLALARAEQEIRSMRLDPASGLADQIRRNELAMAGLNRELERQADAWEKIQSASEQAIDGTIDKLLDGDITGALEGIGSEITSLIAEIGIKNPIKNVLLGADYGTLADLGGFQGIMDRLRGRGDPVSLQGFAEQSVGAMTVNAGSVTVTGALNLAAGTPGIGSTPGIGAANLNTPLGGDWLSYSNQGAVRNQPISDQLKQALSFLEEMGVKMEVFSGGQDGIGEGGNRLGSTRHDHGNAADVFFSRNGRRLDWNNPADVPIYQEIVSRARANGVTGFGAGPGYMQPGSMHIGYGTAAVWGAGGAGQNAPDWLRQAYNTPWAAGMGADPMADAGGAAAKALSTFSSATNTATQDLGTLGGGFDAFGQLLAGIGGGAAQGAGGGGLLWSAASAIAGSIGIPGFATGGRHRGGLRIVGEEGPELEYTGPSTILPADLTRSVLASRPPNVTVNATTAEAPAGAAFGKLPIVVNDYAGQGVEAEIQPDGRGGRQLLMTVGQQGAAAMAQPGNPLRKQMRRMGVRNRPINR